MFRFYPRTWGLKMAKDKAQSNLPVRSKIPKTTQKYSFSMTFCVILCGFWDFSLYFTLLSRACFDRYIHLLSTTLSFDPIMGIFKFVGRPHGKGVKTKLFEMKKLAFSIFIRNFQDKIFFV